MLHCNGGLRIAGRSKCDHSPKLQGPGAIINPIWNGMREPLLLDFPASCRSDQSLGIGQGYGPKAHIATVDLVHQAVCKAKEYDEQEIEHG